MNVSSIDNTSSVLEATATEVLCAVIRGELVEWPPATANTFYETFLHQARYHGVESLVCHLLKSTAAWEELPAQVKDGMMQALKISAVIEMVRARDLVALFEVLQKAGVPILLLKGGALAYTHYPKPYLRARVDTDIFISAAHIRLMKNVLLGQDYKLQGSTYKSHQFKCFREGPGNIAVVYDVHWRSSNVPEYARIISHEEGLRKSMSIPVLDGCPTLGPEQALLLACMHRVGNPHHDPNRLIWLYDIHLLVSGMSESALLRFAKRAVKEDIQVACLEAIRKTRHCFATRIPDDVFEILLSPSKVHLIGLNFGGSYLALIINDLRRLPDTTSRLGLVRELFLPSAWELLQKYNKQNVFWVPVLYLRYLLGGLIKRITLR